MDALTIGRALLAGRVTRKLGTATYVRELGAELIALAYHDTDVVTFGAEGITLRTGGWPTVTTLKRMNDALAVGYRLRVSGSTLRNGMLPKNPREWQVFTTGGDFSSVVASFRDVTGADTVHVVTGQNPYTGRLLWGSNVSDYPPQMVTLPADLLRGYSRDAHDDDRDTCQAPAVVTCGGCGAQWCEHCDPAPAALCHVCHGRGYSTARVA